MFVASTFAKSALKDLVQKIEHATARRNTQPNEVKIVIYVDEAHTLADTQAPPNADDKRLYDVFCSALSYFVPYPLFVLYLSTNSHLGYLSPAQQWARSGRARTVDSMQAPITETPFDCAPNLLIKPSTLKLDDINNVEFLAQFGRPMYVAIFCPCSLVSYTSCRFWTMIEGAKDRKDEIIPLIMELARAKLLCSDSIAKDFGSFSPAAKTAVVDVRLMLDFEPRRQAAHVMTADLVASHMRTSYSVPNNREYLRSGYSSEPIIAEAAAQQLHEFRKQQGRSVVLDILKDNFRTGLLSGGEMGELMGRVLIMEAYDRAVERDHPHRIDSGDCYYSQGCYLTTFIEELFCPDIAAQILQSVPDNIKSDTTFRAAFKGAKVRFTHFGKMADDTGTSTFGAWVSFVRCMAIIPRSGQRAVDCVLPVLMWDEELCEEVVTGVLIQWKNRGAEGTIQAYSIDEKTIGFFPKSASHVANPFTGGDRKREERTATRPYVSLIMELGVRPGTSAGAVTSTKFLDPPKTAPRSTDDIFSTPSKLVLPGQGRLKHSKDKHPRYNIFVYGCSGTIFKGITPADKASYALLLGSRDILAEHPRQDKASLAAVRQQKPFFSGGDNSFHWVDEPSLRKIPEVLQDTFIITEFEPSVSGQEVEDDV
jgi:hypothetical protein